MPEIKLNWEGDNLEAAPGPDDNLGDRYLLARQLAHEYHDPVTQDYIRAAEAAHQAQVEAQQTEMEAFRKEQAKKTETGKTQESWFAEQMLKGLSARQALEHNPLAAAHGQAEPTAPTEPVAAHAQESDGQPNVMPPPTAMGWQPGAKGTPETPEQQVQSELGGAQQPWIDPAQAFGAGAATSFKLSLDAGKALMPSLGRAIVSGIVNVGADTVIGQATEAAESKGAWALALPLNVLLALGSGKVQMAAEEAVVAAAAKVGKVLDPAEIKLQAQAAMRVLTNESGEFNVFHGSPHVFDQFDMGKVGTGEGAQAFGHGLYFSDEKQVADNYRKKGSWPEIVIGGKPIDTSFKPDSPQSIAAGWVQRYAESKDPIGMAENWLARQAQTSGRDVDAQALAIVKEWKVQGATVEPGGATYEVKLHAGKTPDQYDYVEWGKPVTTDQIEKIKAGMGENWDEFENFVEDYFNCHPSDLSGGELYRVLTKAAEEDYLPLSKVNADYTTPAADASKFLLNSGIDGIKYQAGTIRGGNTTGASNYVVFDDRAITPISRETLGGVVERLNQMVQDTPVADIMRILKNEKGEMTIRPGAEPPAPASAKTSVSGVPKPPDMEQAAGEFTANRNPNITTAYAGEKSGGNLRIWDEDLNPKFLSDIESPDDIMRVITGTQDVFAAQKEAAARGVRTWADTEQAANQYGLQDLLGRRVGQASNAEQVENGRRLLVTSAEGLKGMADVIRGGNATDLQKMEFMRAFNVHYAIQMQMSGIAAEAGRALNIFRKTAQSDTLKFGQIQDFLAASQRTGITPEKLADRISMFENPGQVTAFVRQGQRATTIDMWNEAWINGMLWMPSTHLANITSNAVVAAMAVPERLTGAFISKIPGIGSGELQSREALALSYGAFEGMKDGLKVAAKTFRTGKSTDLTTKMDTARPAAITAENVQNLPLINKLSPDAFTEGNKLATAVDFLGEAVRTPGRGLSAEDDFFKAIGYRMELRSRAWRKAVIDEGRTGADAGNRIAEILSDPQTHAPDVHLAAVDFARYQTFTSALKSKIAGALAASRNPLVKAIAPFVSTPYNVMLYSLERTPLAPLSSRWREEFSAGGARRDLALGQMTFGSMVAGTATWMAMNGQITGNGPSDPALRQAWLRAGNKPLTFTMGNWQVDLSRLEPISTLFGYGADLATLTGLTEDNLAPEEEHLAAAIAMTFAKNSTNKTFVEGVSSAIEAMDDPDRYMQQFLQNWAGSTVPSPLKYIERAMSPEKEAIEGMADAIWSKIPWLSEDMPKKRDLWGKTLTLAMDKNETPAQLFYRINSPIQITRKPERNPIDEEFLALKQAPGMPKKTQLFEGVPYKMDANEYEEFQLRMNAVKLSDGLTLKPSLDRLVQSRDYQDVKKRSESQAYLMISSKIEEAKERAKFEMLQENPDMRRIIDRFHQLQQAQ